jgi:hypothetical protein
MTITVMIAFLAGLSVGVTVCWVYLRTLRAKIRLYETYIHERLDKQFVSRSEALSSDSGETGKSLRNSRPEAEQTPSFPAKDVNPSFNSRT